MEVWKDIENYPGYQVSNKGRVRTHNKTSYTKKHGIRHWKNRILHFKSCDKKTGYRVDLWKNGKPKTFLVCRLVATTFLEDLIDTTMTVNHKDGNRLNNNVENLEWLSREDNIRHAFETDLCTSQKHTVIINTSTGAKAKFRSMAQAGQFFNQHTEYISELVKKNKMFFYKNGIKYLVEIPKF